MMFADPASTEQLGAGTGSRGQAVLAFGLELGSLPDTVTAMVMHRGTPAYLG